MQAEETARADDVQSLWQALCDQRERSEARIRLWAEDRLQKERAGVLEISTGAGGEEFGSTLDNREHKIIFAGQKRTNFPLVQPEPRQCSSRISLMYSTLERQHARSEQYISPNQNGS